MMALSLFWILALTVTCGLLLASLLATPGQPPVAVRQRGLIILPLLLVALVLLRPHEDTFTGLDTSCYRLMSQAFTEGRGFHDPDTTLLALPPPLRRAVLLEYEHWGRDTRDRSFEIPSLATALTRPYFYPTLPLAASGLDRLIPRSGDYLVPLLGLLLAAALLIQGVYRGGHPGWMATLALLAGSPLPAYLLRGFYAEAAGAALTGLVLLSLATAPAGKPLRFIPPFLLGVAICFHPALIVLTLPALIVLAMIPPAGPRSTPALLLAFATGLLPLVLMTRWICHPYGDITNLAVIAQNLKGDAVHRLLGVVAATFGLAGALLLLGPSRWRTTVTSRAAALLRNRPLYLLLLLGAMLPLLIPQHLWSGKALVLAGASELGDGIRWHYGLVLLAGVVATFSRTTRLVTRALLILTLLTAPFFLYLKGFEPMGLWSQRRLIPLILTLIVVLSPPLAGALGALQRRKPGLALASGLLLMASALITPISWPAPYWIRHEQGTTAWVDRIANEIGERLVLFDYYPYSVPFSLHHGCRAMGMSEYASAALPDLIGWLATQATGAPVLVATAYANPGLEEGLCLRPMANEHLDAPFVKTRGSLPAERGQRAYDIRLMQALPATRTPGLAVDKILDDGPLALRGPWGRGSLIHTDQGEALPARWSREGSSLIGPIPAPGRSVVITLAGAASRDDGIDGQTLHVDPPWHGAPVLIPLSNTYQVVTAVLTRPQDTADTPATTGLYSLHATRPYDPAQAGLRGYDKDLGARLHRITITLR